MSNLPGHIEDFKQRTFQSTMDKNLAKAQKDDKPFRAGGRPGLVAHDNRIANKMLQDALDATGSNYDD